MASSRLPTRAPRFSRTVLRFLRSGMIAAAVSVLSAPGALAWKPVTHVFLANQALKEALGDGKLTMYAVKYADGTILYRDGAPVVIGRYDVDPDLLRAIQNNLEVFWNGVLGPDGYPDIGTGQEVIHPPSGTAQGDDVNVGGNPAGSDAWLTYLWNLVHSQGNDSDANKAFVAGFLSHAAGDMYGHTFINYYTGGIFAPVNNAIRHVVLEGYLAERTPDITKDGMPGAAPFATAPMPSNLAARFTDIYAGVKDHGLDNGVDSFITNNMVNAGANPAIFGYLRGSGTEFSVPYLFSVLRQKLQGDADSYHAAVADYDNRYNAKASEAAALEQAAQSCSWRDTSCSATADRLLEGVKWVEAGAIATEEDAYKAMNWPVVAYKLAWIGDIDSGLAAWPRLSQKLAVDLFFNDKGEADWTQAHLDIDAFKPTLLNMMGVPDAATAVLDAIDSTIIPIKSAIDDLKSKMMDYVLLHTFGKTEAELKDLITGPHRFLDPLFTQVPHPITVAALNQIMHVQDAGYNDPSKKFDWHTFPPAYNTVTMIKLLLMKPSEVDRLISDLHSTSSLTQNASTNPPNAMVGFISSLDGQNQWLDGGRMVMARDPQTYKSLFMRMTPPGSAAEDTADKQPAYPPATITPSFLYLHAGDTVTLRSNFQGDWNMALPGLGFQTGGEESTARAPDNKHRGAFPITDRQRSSARPASAGASTAHQLQSPPPRSDVQGPATASRGRSHALPAGIGAAVPVTTARPVDVELLAMPQSPPTLSANGATATLSPPASVQYQQAVTINLREAQYPFRSASSTIVMLPDMQISRVGHGVVHAGDSVQFAVTPTQPMDWRAMTTAGDNIGSISSSGLFTAPKAVETSTIVVIRAFDRLADDQVMTGLRLEPVPPPLFISPASPLLKPGETVELHLTPNVMASWTVDGGPDNGVIGAASTPDWAVSRMEVAAFRARLDDFDRQIAVYGKNPDLTRKWKLDRPIAHPTMLPKNAPLRLTESERTTLLPEAKANAAPVSPQRALLDHPAADATFQPEIRSILDARSSFVAANAGNIVKKIDALESADRTYHAPDVTAPRRVTVRATALDGSGRTAAVSITILPALKRSGTTKLPIITPPRAASSIERPKTGR